MLDPFNMRSISKSLLKNNAAIQVLSLNHCCINDSGVLFFIRELQMDSFQYLTHLSLADNKISK